MKKKEVYTPLFEMEDSPIEKVTCLCCGKPVKETLVNQNGICIECIMNNKINSDDVYLIPNQKLFSSFFQQYEQYLKTKPKNPAYVSGMGMLGFLGAMAVNFAAESSQSSCTNSKFDFISQTIKPSSFDKCNKMTVSIRDESWVCPCCNHDNYGAHFCEVCGVYPKFKLED